jgi:hypothetical protein
MKAEQLEALVKNLEEQNKALQNKLITLENKVITLEDIEAIKKIERAYGYYLEHMLYDELAELWADDGELQWVGLGVFRGKDTVRQAWKTLRENEPPEFVHLAMQVSPYITINPDGKTAYGRWYCIGGGGMQGLYENEYVKENGIWKIKILQYGSFPLFTLLNSSNSTDNQAGPPPGINDNTEDKDKMFERDVQKHMNRYPFTERWSRLHRQEWAPYIRPFSFKHPVTGKDTANKTVEVWNKTHPSKMTPGGENWLK